MFSIVLIINELQLKMASDLNSIFDKHLNSLNRETRSKLLNLFQNDPLFIPKFDVSLREEKEIAQQRLQKVCDLKVVSIRDFLTNPENIFTTHEVVSIFILLFSSECAMDH